ncbi:MAG: ATP-dependent helicase HrpB [Polyangiales bacterium]
MKKSALPIDAELPSMMAALRENRGLVVSAEPGAGKTTRLPPAMLDEVQGQILVVEPRRLAARLACERVAHELGEKVGERVGYQVRFDKKTSDRTRLLFMTEGILIRRLASDSSLRGVGAVVFDEVHERHLQGDLALAMVAKLRDARRARGEELFVVAMSATLDAKPLSSFLDAPYKHVSGRVFPVDIQYGPAGDERNLDARVAEALSSVLRTDDEGDVLVFLPGAAEIRRAGQRCSAACKRHGIELTTLHGDLSAKEQSRVVAAGGNRKVVLSTNVAESSVTLPGVTTVIDSGLVRRASYSPWTGLPTLRVERISQASAIQRAGRAGRVRAGRAIRLFTKTDFERRDAHETPEIARLDLSELVLLLRAEGHDPFQFDYFEAPPKRALESAEDLLRRLGALRANKNDEGNSGDSSISDDGRRLLRLPVHPRLGRLVLSGVERSVGARACLIAALLGERALLRETRDQSGTADVLVELEAFETAEAERLRDRELYARGIDIGVYRNVGRVTRQLQRSARAGNVESSLWDEDEALRSAIALAFPDRIGRREGRRVVFAGGGSGELDESSVVREGEFVVAVRVQDRSERGGRGKTRVRSACELSGEMMLELFGDAIETTSEVRFDATTEQVESVEALVYEGLVLDESVRRDGYGDAVAECLATAALEAGLQRFFDMDAVELLERRARFAVVAGLELELDDKWRMLALTKLCVGRRSFSDLKGASMVQAMRDLLPSKKLGLLTNYAPEHVSLPGRRRVHVNYEVDRPPWIASRLQDFFGLASGPTAGSIPLVLHLLAPNRRAVQVTTDLSGFWERHYPALRRQLSRRYPRHDWREDPLGKG